MEGCILGTSGQGITTDDLAVLNPARLKVTSGDERGAVRAFMGEAGTERRARRI
jgi:hypothetical protein